MYHGGIQVTPPDYTNPTETPPFRTARQSGISLAMTMEVWVDLIQVGHMFLSPLIYNTEMPESLVSGEVPAELERVWVILSTARRSDFTELISCLIF